MKVILFFIIFISLLVNADKNAFTNLNGKILIDDLIRFKYESQEAIFENSGNIPLEVFSDDDKKYILKYNEVDGFLSSFRFKINLEKKRWGRIKYEHSRTPFYMDVFKNKYDTIYKHKVLLADDYEEYNSISLDAQGYSLYIKNQNLFPINNIIIESKIIFEKEIYKNASGIYFGENDNFSDVISTNLVNYYKEEILSLIPGEDITIYSPCAVLTRHSLDREIIIDESIFPTQEDIIEGFGNWDEHSREKRDRLLGVYFRIGISNNNGNIIWRNESYPKELSESEWDNY